MVVLFVGHTLCGRIKLQIHFDFQIFSIIGRGWRARRESHNEILIILKLMCIICRGDVYQDNVVEILNFLHIQIRT
jgi:hypothetical protein